MTADCVGGVWPYALELARALAPRRIDIVLATMGAPLSVGQRAAASALSNLSLRESAFRLEWMREPWDDVDRAGDWLLALEREQRPDIVHLNGYAHGTLPFEAPVLVVAHSCVCSWWRAVRGGEAPAEWDVYRARVASGLRAADLVAAPTRAMLDTLTTNYGAMPPSCVIPNGREATDFAPSPRKESFILAAGRLWDEAKNVDALDRVAPRLAWPVYVAGDARGPEGGTRPIGSARFLGPLPSSALAWWMGRAGVFAAPARYEPFGLTPLEAALAGCALVLGDIPSLREVWGEAACFVPPDDDEALADALQRLAADAGARAACAGRVRERARAFSVARMAEGYERAYRALGAGVRRAGGRSAADAEVPA